MSRWPRRGGALRAGLLLGCATVWIASAIVAPAGAASAAHPARGAHLMARRGGSATRAATRATAALPHMHYYGGRVISNVKVYAVIWGAGTYYPEVGATVAPSISSLLTNVTNSSYLDWLSEYDTTVPGGTQQHIGRGTFAGLFTITPAAANNGATVDDGADIQPELDAQIAHQHLPAPDANTVYVLFFRKGQLVTEGGSDSKTGFCAYHGTTPVTPSVGEAFYAVMPYQDPQTGCDYSTTPFTSLSAIVTHELVEAITDPEVGLADTIGPPLGWYDATNNYEISDACNTSATVAGNDGNTYVVETAWSNAHSACIAATSSAPGAPTNVGATAGDHMATVSWTAAVPNGSPIASYIVSAPGATGVAVDPSTTAVVVPNLVNGHSYAFTVTAFDGLGNGTPSAPSNPVVPAGKPGAPTGVAAVGGVGNARVSWNAAAPNGASITSYTVIASPGHASTSVGGASTHATVSGLTRGVAYSFRVHATNARGQGPWSAPSPAVVVSGAVKSGYWMLGADGRVYNFGNAPHYGDAPSAAVAIAARGDGAGYWTVDPAGRVSAFGAATRHGGPPRLTIGEHVRTIAATPTGDGYWLFTNLGRAFPYGDASFYGDMSGVALNGPIVASVATPTGQGYYMVGSDGGVFGFGDAHFRGSMGSTRLNRPVVGISPTPDNRGYWLVASDGGVFGFDAPFRGSMANVRLNQPVNGLIAFGSGYLMIAADGGVFAFSDLPFAGSLGARRLAAPVVGVASHPPS